MIFYLIDFRSDLLFSVFSFWVLFAWLSLRVPTGAVYQAT